jgi:hypothetical protein
MSEGVLVGQRVDVARVYLCVCASLHATHVDIARVLWAVA